MVNVLVPIANGSEEMEAVIIVDTLRRAGWEVTLAAVGADTAIAASRGVRIVADAPLADVASRVFDAVVLPGGAGGTAVFRRSTALLEILRSHARSGKLVAAICAAPLVLQDAGLLDGRAATCHPGVADEFTATVRRVERVVEDGNLVTSQGPGTTIEFALTLIRRLAGPKAADRVADGLVTPRLFP